MPERILQVLYFPFTAEGGITLGRRARQAVMALAVLVTVYGALLRLDAYCGKYGALDHPAWAFVATHELAAIARHLRPASVHWARVPQPYVGGDPINYLRFAREMTTFYQPHVREPVFLALTRVWLRLLDNQDAAVSFASATGSILAIFGTFLLGSELFSPLAGLLAAIAAAMEYDLITWSVDGWRDDVFMAAVAFAAWALLRFRRRPTFRNALLVGFTAGFACLTRITALTFVVPALVWVALAGARSGWKERAVYTSVAALICAALLGPFLISCAIATGDPLYAINYHTVYYRAAEGLPIAKPMTASAYLRDKLSSEPVGTIDTGVTGVFVRPFSTKWFAFAVWRPMLPSFLRWLSAIALAGMIFFPAGRLALVVLFTSLLPYAFTWSLGDGGAWRFTMNAYPFYLAAAALTVVGGARLAARVRAASSASRGVVMRRLAIRSGIAIAAAAVLTCAYVALPWFVVREQLRHGESVSIEAGGRDEAFYRSGWSRARDEHILVRVSIAPRVTVYFPLVRGFRYDAVLRMDPVEATAPTSVAVLFNSQLVANISLGWNPQRMGAYVIPLPGAWVNDGSNALTLVPDTTVPARAAGPRFAWIPSSASIALRVWQVRLTGTLIPH